MTWRRHQRRTMKEPPTFTGTLFGLSYISDDAGVSFSRASTVNFRFSLVVAA